MKKEILRRICMRCQREIGDKENYLCISEFNEGKTIKVNFVHKKCWEDIMAPKKLAMGMVGRTLRLLNKAEERLA